MPILWLLWVMVGVIFMIIGVIRLGSEQGREQSYVRLDKEQDESTNDLQELFSYYLEEEEKKNQGFRESLLMAVNIHNESMRQPTSNPKKNYRANESLYSEVIRRYEAGESLELIAKNLKKGVGEIKLILSLYSMK